MGYGYYCVHSWLLRFFQHYCMILLYIGFVGNSKSSFIYLLIIQNNCLYLLSYEESKHLGHIIKKKL